MTGRLVGKVAIVTGAADGMGAAITERFLKEGAGVVAVDLTAEMMFSCEGQTENVVKLVGDLAAADTSTRAVSAAIEHFGRLDIVMNNAGISEFSALEERSEAVWDRHFNVNVKAMWRMCIEAVPHLKVHGAGRIINTASISVHRSNLHHAAYSASKSAVVGLTRSLAVDLGPDGITANAILPGMVLTRMMQGALAQYPEREVQLRGLSVFDRMATPDEIAGPAVFLASDDSSFVTGHSLVVDGGVIVKM